MIQGFGIEQLIENGNPTQMCTLTDERTQTLRVVPNTYMYEYDDPFVLPSAACQLDNENLVPWRQN